MKSMVVKDVSAALMNLPGAQPVKSGNAGDFQKVWKEQMNRNAQDSQDALAQRRASTDSKTEETSQDDGQVRPIGPEDSSEVSKEQAAEEGQAVSAEQGVPKLQEPLEELSPEELEKIMELLATTATELMQQLADAFGITLEELQAVMGELKLEPMDLLDATVLGGLILQLGGEEDFSALVTDEGLYDNYRMLMEQLQNALKENSKELNMAPEELVRLAKEGTELQAPVEEVVLEVPQETLETAESDSGPKIVIVDNGGLDRGQETQNATDQNGGQMQEGQRQSQSNSEKGEYGNLLIQNIRAEQFVPNGVQAEGAVQSSPWTAQTQDIMNQIMDYMRIQLSPDTNSLEMQLHPASLGTLQVQIASKGGVVTANFITQNEAVKAALESQMVQLKESFEEQGVKIQAIEVTVQTHQFERNLEQGRGRNQQESGGKRNRARRMRIEDAPTVETMDEEDLPAGRRLVMGGSTVDYTA